MKKHVVASFVCATAAFALLLTGCGNNAASSGSSAASAASETAAVSQMESAMETTALSDSAAEASVAEPSRASMDERIAALLGTSSTGAILACHMYDEKGTPIRNGTVILSADNQGAWQSTTDDEGIAVLGGIVLNTNYEIIVTTQEGDPVGSLLVRVAAGDAYAAAPDKTGVLVISVTDDNSSIVELSLTATQEAAPLASGSTAESATGEVQGSFTCSDVSKYELPAGVAVPSPAPADSTVEAPVETTILAGEGAAPTQAAGTGTQPAADGTATGAAAGAADGTTAGGTGGTATGGTAAGAADGTTANGAGGTATGGTGTGTAAGGTGTAATPAA